MKWGDNENMSEGSNPEMPVQIFGRWHDYNQHASNHTSKP
jgi:hypothetical protein